MRYYLKGTGVTTYDSNGLTYPYQEEVDFKVLLREYGATNFEWERYLGLSNHPYVLSFDLKTPENVQEINNRLFAYRLLVRRHWELERVKSW